MRSVIYASATMALIVLVAFSPLGYASSTSNGTFTMKIGGHLITGQLTDWTIQADNTVSALTSVQQTVPISWGSAHVVGSGKLVGSVSGSSVHGSEHFSGTVELCFMLFFCQSGGFVGIDSWAGTFQNGKGSGTFQGMITLNQTVLGVPQEMGFTGTWSIS
jgi:hypothetical protein